MNPETRNQNALSALLAFARQRPGLEPANYGDWRAYRQESREITRDLHQVESLALAVSQRSIGADALMRACRDSYSGRLSMTETETGCFRINYCTGQYFPTEYRRAVCAVLSSALWDYWRECGYKTGDDIRKEARRSLPRAVAMLWFR